MTEKYVADKGTRYKPTRQLNEEDIGNLPEKNSE